MGFFVVLSFDSIVYAEALSVALAGDPGDVLWVNANSVHTNTLCILYRYC